MNLTLSIRLPRPHPAQQRVINEARRFNVLVCGRRWGKTRLGIDRAVHGVIQGKPVGWFAPTYKYLAEPWRILTAVLRGAVVGEPNKTERRIECRTGGSLEFWSLDSGEAGRGRAYGDLIIDEAALVMDLKETFESALQPTLLDLKGGAWLLSTPKGYDGFFGFYERGQDLEPRFAEWRSWQMPSVSNPTLDPAEIELARATSDPRYFAQEYEASFEETVGRVYFRFEREANVAPVEDTGGELLVGMDFNVAPMSACVAVLAGDQLHVLDELELVNSDTAEMCQALAARYRGRPVSVYPDPSGNARKTSAPVGTTDFTIIRQHGFAVRAPAAAPPVVDRINEVNALCQTGDGRRRLFVHPRCRAVIRSLTQLLYKDGASVVDKTSGLDHMADALGYLVHGTFPIAQAGGVVRVRWG